MPSAPPASPPRCASARLAVAAMAAGLCCLLVGNSAAAQTPDAGAHHRTLALAGSMGTQRALLMVDGQPLVLAVGATARGVTLLRLQDGEALVQTNGRQQRLRLGATPQALGPAPLGLAATPPAPGNNGRPGPPGTEPVLAAGTAATDPAASGAVVLTMAAGGHFESPGWINGQRVQFLVDTGASVVALSQAEASRIGLAWQNGRRLMSQTANGTVPVHGITLASLRLGDVELTQVEAVVVPAQMPLVLLGNSALNRLTMRRDSDVMHLQKKP